MNDTIAVMHWFSENYKWLFDGVGGAVAIAAIGYLIQHFFRRARDQERNAALTAIGGAEVASSPVATGSDIKQTINSPTYSPTLNLNLPAPTLGTPVRERYDEWRELIDEIHESIQRLGYAFIPLVPVTPGDDRNDYKAGIRRGNRVLGNRILIADAVQKAGLKKDWDELVHYAHSVRGPIDRWQQGSPTMGGFEMKAREFQERLMRAAREDMSGPGQTSKNAQTGEEFDTRFPVTVERRVSRVIDRGSGEERKEIWEQRPDIVLEWTAGTGAKRDKGTFRNIGKRSGFSVKTGSFSWPELQFVAPVQINAIHPDKELAVELPVVEKTGPSSMLVGSLDSFLRDQKFKERDDLKLSITFSDAEGHSFEREFTLCAGPGGNFGPRVITSLGPLQQAEPESIEPKAPRGLSAKRWDVFISHASEDKEKVARPLADALKKRGFLVWYDDFTLKLGDSLRESIDRGLAESRFGVVILSKHFFAKRWPSKELNGLTAIEIGGEKVILPVWHGVTHDDVVQYSPTLADRKAVNTGGGLDRVVADIEEVLNPPMTEDLHEQLHEAEETLQEYRCPCCGSPLSTRSSVPLSEHDEGAYEDFECGYAHIDGYMQRPCPSDSKFPKLDDYDFIYKELQGDSNWRWQCFASGKTKEARMVSLMSGSGRTKEEAREQVEKWYREYAEPWKKR